jgi:hypothetical protein
MAAREMGAQKCVRSCAPPLPSWSYAAKCFGLLTERMKLLSPPPWKAST